MSPQDRVNEGEMVEASVESGAEVGVESDVVSDVVSDTKAGSGNAQSLTAVPPEGLESPADDEGPEGKEDSD